MRHIFEGLKVIDCASFIAAPAAATILSDFGADVVKIEPPGVGDAYRATSSSPGQPTSDRNYGWMLDARNKRSLAVDLGSAHGKEILARLVSSADVFITNYPAPVRRKLGFGYDAMAALNPRLIYASFTGYGERGDEAEKPGFDTTAWWARSGLMGAVVPSAGAVPARSVGGMGDHPSSLALFSGIVMALYQRQGTGKGTEVTSSLLANGMWANGLLAQAALCGATFHDRPVREHSLNALGCYYRCRDGLWLILSIHNEVRQWGDLLRCLDREDLLEDPCFATKPDRLAHARDLIAVLDETFRRHDREVWRGRLNAKGIIFDIVATPADIHGDRQMLDNDILVPFADDPTLTINSPVFLRDVEKVRPRLPPELGQHTDEVLREIGYDDAAIAAMRKAAAVG